MISQTVPNPHHIFKPIEGFALAPADFPILLRIIIEFAERACLYQLNQLAIQDDETNEQFEARVRFVKSLYVPKIRFQGENGVIITSTVESPEAADNLPENIDKIEIETHFAYRSDINKDPPHLLYLLLD